MQKFISLFKLLVAISLISLAACGQLVPTPIPTLAPTSTSMPAPTATSAPTVPPGDSEHKVTVQNMERSYTLHVPPQFDTTHPASLVIAFHGAGSSPGEMAYATELNMVADKAGFLIAYPSGLGQTWNDGGPFGYAQQTNADEPAFVRAILSNLGMLVSIDPKRIFAVGFSNGGALIYRLACEMSDTFAAVVSVAGTSFYSPCQPSQPVSLMEVHGMNDTVLPYTGGGQLEAPPTEELIRTWAKLDGCTDSPQVTKENIIIHTIYDSCTSGTAVELYVIELGGHSWPSKYVWDASSVIWSFFDAHPKQ